MLLRIAGAGEGVGGVFDGPLSKKQVVKEEMHIQSKTGHRCRQWLLEGSNVRFTVSQNMALEIYSSIIIARTYVQTVLS